MACVNGRTDPDLWEKSKKQAIEKLGGRFSARAMQLAGKLYRDAGGGYCGKKTKAQKSMSKWTDEDWTTADGKPARRTVDGKVVYDRYLPRAAWKKLSKAQKAATRRKKRASDDQFVANTAKAAKAGKSARGESMSYLERYRELTQKRVVAPWDRLTEAVGAKFVDVGGMSAKEAKGAVLKACAIYFGQNPTETVFFIRDTKRLLNPEDTAKAIEKYLSDPDYGSNHGAFGFDNADHEIYADGPGPMGGEWDYAVTQARDSGQNQALEKMPPKTKVEPVKGKTGDGWKVTIAHPYQTYIDAGIKAAEQEAASMVLKGFYPTKGEQSPYSHAPKGLRDKYLKHGPKKAPSKKQESRKPNEAVQRLSESRATDMARLKKLAGIGDYVRSERDVRVRLETASGASPTAVVIKALDGKRTAGGNLIHEPDPSTDDYVAFATPEGETLDGDDYDYPGLVASYNKYAKKLKQEVLTLLAKAKVTGWTDVAVTNGGVYVYKAK